MALDLNYPSSQQPSPKQKKTSSSSSSTGGEKEGGFSTTIASTKCKQNLQKCLGRCTTENLLIHQQRCCILQQCTCCPFYAGLQKQQKKLFRKIKQTDGAASYGIHKSKLQNPSGEDDTILWASPTLEVEILVLTNPRGTRTLGRRHNESAQAKIGCVMWSRKEEQPHTWHEDQRWIRAARHSNPVSSKLPSVYFLLPVPCAVATRAREEPRCENSRDRPQTWSTETAKKQQWTPTPSYWYLHLCCCCCKYCKHSH